MADPVPGMCAVDGEELACLFARWLAKEELASLVTEQECAHLARAFMAGYAHGLYGNAEPSPSLVSPHQRAPEGKSEQAHGSGHGKADLRSEQG